MKKVPIEEVVEKSNSERLRLWLNGSFAEIQMPFDDGEWSFDEGYSPNFASFFGDNSKHKAIYTLHCLNNFQPLLEALIVAKWRLDCPEEYTPEDCVLIDRAIKSASFVEVSE